MAQSDDAAETLTTDEAMHALFPQSVIDEAKRLVQAEPVPTQPISEDVSLASAL
jgi:hypothetical protein